MSFPSATASVGGSAVTPHFGARGCSPGDLVRPRVFVRPAGTVMPIGLGSGLPIGVQIIRDLLEAPRAATEADSHHVGLPGIAELQASANSGAIATIIAHWACSTAVSAGDSSKRVPVRGNVHSGRDEFRGTFELRTRESRSWQS